MKSKVFIDVCCFFNQLPTTKAERPARLKGPRENTDWREHLLVEEADAAAVITLPVLKLNMQGTFSHNPIIPTTASLH